MLLSAILGLASYSLLASPKNGWCMREAEDGKVGKNACVNRINYLCTVREADNH